MSKNSSRLAKLEQHQQAGEGEFILLWPGEAIPDDASENATIIKIEYVDGAKWRESRPIVRWNDE